MLLIKSKSGLLGFMIRAFLSGTDPKKNTFGKRSSDENQEDPAMSDQGIVLFPRKIAQKCIKKHINNCENRHFRRSRQKSVLLKATRWQCVPALLGRLVVYFR